MMTSYCSSEIAEKTILYSALTCPFSQRIAIALKEAEIEHETVLIDLSNKPEWYKDVNVDKKVPSLTTYGINFAEPSVLIELINELKPQKRLLPTDPVKRAQIRFVIQYYWCKVSLAWFSHFQNLKGSDSRKYIAKLQVAYTRINELLLQQSPMGPYFLGQQYSLADIVIAPFASQLETTHKAFLSGIVQQEINQIKQCYPRLQEFIQGIVNRPSFKETYPGDELIIESFQRAWKK
ncbi:glutathione S-transferase [Phascolomyces articulosus]|uniref:Glutathione S-transferase n=1 Tax=Phascolomyces articulosus TaxID=60185 RepID=A0AAD5PI53_9FUNG|nr:glutathione S-transferase [Phascolomyces articulosus]